MFLILYSLLIFSIYSKNGINGLNCYQCNESDSKNNLFCSEPYLMSEYIQPTSCNNTFNAKYCIKEVSRFSSISRYCSPYDLGDICSVVDYTGGDKNQRLCVYTCSTDGCNSSQSNFNLVSFLIIFILCLLSLFYNNKHYVI